MQYENNIKIFNYEGKQMRVVMKDGVPWWIGKDVCDILGISKYRDAISNLDEDEELPVKVNTFSGIQEMTAISESGLYTLIMRSNKPETKKFRKWVTAVNTLLEAIKEERDKVNQLERQIEDNRENITSGREVQEALNSNKTILTGAFNRIERSGNLILAWLDSGEAPKVDYRSMKTDLYAVPPTLGVNENEHVVGIDGVDYYRDPETGGMFKSFVI